MLYFQDFFIKVIFIGNIGICSKETALSLQLTFVMRVVVKVLRYTITAEKIFKT